MFDSSRGINLSIWFYLLASDLTFDFLSPNIGRTMRFSSFNLIISQRCHEYHAAKDKTLHGSQKYVDYQLKATERDWREKQVFRIICSKWRSIEVSLKTTPSARVTIGKLRLNSNFYSLTMTYHYFTSLNLIVIKLSLDEILNFDNSNESCWDPLSWGAVHCVIQGDSILNCCVLNSWELMHFTRLFGHELRYGNWA